MPLTCCVGEVRAALVSKVLLNVFATGSGTVTAGQLSLADRRGLAGVIVILIERFGRLSPMGLSSV